MESLVLLLSMILDVPDPKDPHPKQNKRLVRGPRAPCELEGSTPNPMEGPRIRVRKKYVLALFSS